MTYRIRSLARTALLSLLTLVGLATSGAIRAEVLARSQWVLPLDAATIKNTQVPVRIADPGKQVWVAYKLLAVSEAEKPRGNLVIDAAFEGIPVPLTASKVLFEAEKLVRSAPSAAFRESLAAKVGQRTPEDLAKTMGPEMYAVYKAVSEERGSILQGTVVMQYPATGKDEVQLLASIDRVNGMQPVVMDLAIGQGEIPADLQPRAAGWPMSLKVGIFLATVMIAGLLWFLTRRPNG